MNKVLKAAVRGAAQEYWQEAKTWAMVAGVHIAEWADKYTAAADAVDPETPVTEYRYVFVTGFSAWYPVSQRTRPVATVIRVEFR